MATVEKNLAQLELLILLAVRRLSAPDRHLSQIALELENNTSRWINEDVLNLAVRDVYSLAEGQELWGRISASAKRYAQLKYLAFLFF